MFCNAFQLSGQNMDFYVLCIHVSEAVVEEFSFSLCLALVSWAF